MSANNNYSTPRRVVPHYGLIFVPSGAGKSTLIETTCGGKWPKLVDGDKIVDYTDMVMKYGHRWYEQVPQKEKTAFDEANIARLDQRAKREKEVILFWSGLAEMIKYVGKTRNHNCYLAMVEGDLLDDHLKARDPAKGQPGPELLEDLLMSQEKLKFALPGWRLRSWTDFEAELRPMHATVNSFAAALTFPNAKILSPGQGAQTESLRTVVVNRVELWGESTLEKIATPIEKAPVPTPSAPVSPEAYHDVDSDWKMGAYTIGTPSHREAVAAYLVQAKVWLEKYPHADPVERLKVVKTMKRESKDLKAAITKVRKMKTLTADDLKKMIIQEAAIEESVDEE